MSRGRGKRKTKDFTKTSLPAGTKEICSSHRQEMASLNPDDFMATHNKEPKEQNCPGWMDGILSQTSIMCYPHYCSSVIAFFLV